MWLKRVLVSGAGGFVGSRIMQQLTGRFELIAFPQGMLAEADEEAVRAFMVDSSPDVIIHTAAISGTKDCEAQPEASYRANVEMPIWMARCARQVHAKLLCFSSDQVYTGIDEVGPFPEDTPVYPANVYGRHKLEAEQRVLDILPQAVMLRATWMYDFPGYGLPTHGNLLMNLLKASMRRERVCFSANEYRGITYVRHAIEMLIPAMTLEGGVYNYGSENRLSMFDTAKDFADTLEVDVDLEKTYFQRSLAIDGGKLRRAGIHLDDTQEGLKRCLKDYRL